MNVYIFDCDGYYFGGVVVVVADNEEVAMSLAKVRILKYNKDHRGKVDMESVTLREVNPLKTPSAIFFYEGDY